VFLYFFLLLLCPNNTRWVLYCIDCNALVVLRYFIFVFGRVRCFLFLLAAALLLVPSRHRAAYLAYDCAVQPRVQAWNQSQSTGRARGWWNRNPVVSQEMETREVVAEEEQRMGGAAAFRPTCPPWLQAAIAGTVL
jgi:hypothetical protein